MDNKRSEYASTQHHGRRCDLPRTIPTYQMMHPPVNAQEYSVEAAMQRQKITAKGIGED